MSRRFSQLLVLAMTLASITTLLISQVACQKSTTKSELNLNSESSSIVNGQPAGGQELWAKSIVGLAERSPIGQVEIFCTGILIGPDKVVTAAHCIEDASNMMVVFGLSEKAANLQSRDAVSAVANEKYDPNAPDSSRDMHDIGIVHFGGGMPTGYEPMLILADDTLLHDGIDAILAGYGVTDGRTQTGAGILRYTDVKVKNALYGEHEVQTDESLSGSCNGDSGGPAMLENGGSYYLWGVTSRGDDNCVEEGVYTRVTAFREWVTAH